MKKNYWQDVIFTNSKEESVNLLKKAGFISSEGKISQNYFENNLNEMRLAKITQYCLSRSFNKDNLLSNKLKLLYNNQKLQKKEMFILWAFLEGKMFNVLITETKKYLKNEISKSLINQEKFYSDIFEILTETINEDFLDAIIMHKYFLEEKQNVQLTAKDTTNDFIKNILGNFVWFKDIYSYPFTIIMSLEEYNKLSSIKDLYFNDYYSYTDNLAILNNKTNFADLFISDYMTKYSPPSVVIALEEYSTEKKKHFIKIIRLNISNLIEEQIELSKTINSISKGNLDDKSMNSNELLNLIKYITAND